MSKDEDERFDSSGRRYPSGTTVQRVGPLSWPQLRIMRRAHAVADWKFGFKIKQVTIVPSDGALGTAKTKGLQLRRLEHEKLTGKHYHDMIVTLLAGEEAQRRFNPRSMRRHGAASDHRSAKEVLIRLHEDAEKECFHAFRYLRARARNFISNPQNWRLIEDLAKALLERRTLTGEEVNDVLQASTRAQMQAWREQRPQP